MRKVLSISAFGLLLGHLLSCSLPLYSQNFTSVGPMIEGREGNTATLLQNGTVLITGGDGIYGGEYNQAIPYAEIYTPGAGFAITEGKMYQPRAAATAFLATNGNVAIIGGVDASSNPVNSIETYSYTNETFSFALSLPSQPDVESQLQDGTILIFYKNSAATAIYNPLTNVLTSATSDSATATGRYLFKKPDGTILVMVPGQVSRVYTASPTGGSFAPIGTTVSTAALPQGAVGTLLPSGNVFFSGGYVGNQGVSTTELWNPASGFTAGPAMSTPRFYHSSIALLDGTVLIAGGDVAVGNGSPFGTGHQETSSVQIYNPMNNSFSTAPNLNYSQFAMASTYLADGSVFICGGISIQQGTGGPGTNLAYTYTYPLTTGGLYPKYIVLGVVYSPPGSKSSAVYSTSDTVGTGTTITSAFSQNTVIGVSVMGASAPGTQPGSQPPPAPGKPAPGSDAPGNTGIATSETGMAGFSENWSQQTNNSDSVSITTTTSDGVAAELSSSAAVGVNHDADSILIWLNPRVILSTGVLPNFATWRGFQINSNDIFSPNDLDVVQISVLCLKAPYIQNCQNPSDRLAKGWDISGLGGLTSDDFNSILKSDPFVANNQYDPDTDTLHRFDVQTGLLTNYVAAQAGITPTGAPETYMRVVTTTQGQGATDTHQVGFTADASLKGLLPVTFNGNGSDTMTWTNTWNTTQTQTNTFNASVTVVPPAFSDSYPSSSPSGFQVYKDNVYGTFMWYAPGYSPSYTSNSPGQLTLNASSYSFKPITAVGSASNSILVVVTNKSTFPITMDSGHALSFSTASFSIVSGTDGCSGKVVPPGGTCSASVQFTPQGTDVPRTGTASVTGTMYASGLTIATIFTSASLTGVAEPTILPPTAATFGSIAFQNISATIPMTFTNKGTSPLALAGYSLSDESFILGSGTDSCSGHTLAGGQSCSIPIQFSPYAPDITKVGSNTISGTLTLRSTTGYSASVGLSGTAMVTVLGTSGSGSGAVSGTEQVTTTCTQPSPPAQPNCYPSSWDSGVVGLVILQFDRYHSEKGYNYQTSYSLTSTKSEIASNLAATINADPSAPVIAAASGNGLAVTSKYMGGVTDYALAPYASSSYSNSSFKLTVPSTLSGGVDPRY